MKGRVLEDEAPLRRKASGSSPFGQEAPQNFLSGASDHCRRQGASEDKNYGVKPTPPKTDSSSCLGIWLADPFAKVLDASAIWRSPHPFPPVRAPFLTTFPFDWQGTERPCIPKSELIIYEMHVRGFTAHPSSKSASPGTYRAIIDKIPYLKKLGINAIELMPIYEFDELINKTVNPFTQETLPNYWGYQPLSFFSPKRNFASAGPLVTDHIKIRANILTTMETKNNTNPISIKADK